MCSNEIITREDGVAQTERTSVMAVVQRLEFASACTTTRNERVEEEEDDKEEEEDCWEVPKK